MDEVTEDFDEFARACDGVTLVDREPSATLPSEANVEELFVRGVMIIERVLLDGSVGVSISDFIRDSDRIAERSNQSAVARAARVFLTPFRFIWFAMSWLTWEVWGRAQYRAAVTNGLAKWRRLSIDKGLARWRHLAGIKEQAMVDCDEREGRPRKPIDDKAMLDAAALHEEIIRSKIVREELPPPDLGPLQ